MLPPPHSLLPSAISGTLAFYATSLSSQYIQYKLLKISTGTRPSIIPITVGIMTVAMGSWMGHLAGLGATAAAKFTSLENNSNFQKRSWMPWNRIDKNSKSSYLSYWTEQCTLILEQNIIPMKNAACRTIHEMTRPMTMMTPHNSSNNYNNKMQHERREAWMHAARICIFGILTYKTLFRSNFISLSPSSYTARGSFARKGIPIIASSSTSSFNYATQSQRNALEKIGRRFGCHTCGSRLLRDNSKKIIFHGDHIPPVSVAKQINSLWYNRIIGRTVAQKFYPQCTICSNKQGGLLSRAVNSGHRNLHVVGGGSESYFHGWRMRVGHFTGGVVAAVSTVGVAGNDDNDKNDDDEEAVAVMLVQSSRDRVRSIQHWLEDLLLNVKRGINR